MTLKVGLAPMETTVWIVQYFSSKFFEVFGVLLLVALFKFCPKHVKVSKNAYLIKLHS